MGPSVFHPDQQVLHGGRRASFLRMSRGAAIIRYWGDSHAVSVPPEALSLPPSTNRARQHLAARDEPLSRQPPARDAATKRTERLSA